MSPHRAQDCSHPLLLLWRVMFLTTVLSAFVTNDAVRPPEPKVRLHQLMHNTKAGILSLSPGLRRRSSSSPSR